MEKEVKLLAKKYLDKTEKRIKNNLEKGVICLWYGTV